MRNNRVLMATSLVLTLVAGVVGPAVQALATAPVNDNFSQATEVTDLPFSETLPIDEATVEGGEGLPCVPPFPYPGQTVWYSFSPTTSGVVRATNGASFYYRFMAAYRQDGVGLAGLSTVDCASWIYGQQAFEFDVEAGVTYYIQVGSNFAGTTGSTTLSMEWISPLPGDNFQDARAVTSLPFIDATHATAATFEAFEPIPTCASGLSLATVWYAFTPSASGSYTAISLFSGIWSSVAIYMGSELPNLSEIGCQLFDKQLSFQATAGTTYYFQVARQAGEDGWLNFKLDRDAVQNQLPIGFHDISAGDVAGPDCVAAGWAVDPDDLSARLTVRISSDGSILGETTAQLFRQDLIDAGVSPDGLAGFVFDLRGHISVGEPHTILVEAQDAQTAAWQPLADTPKVVTCADSPPEGTHDGVSGNQPPWSCVANGWAVDPDDRTARLTVRILVDGQEVTSTVANLFRPDLIDAGNSPDGLAGFNINLWGLISHKKSHEIRAQAQDNETGEWVDLDSTPRTLRCSVPPPGSGIGFSGQWTAIDLDGSTLKMKIGVGETPQVTYQDSSSTFCDNSPSPRWVGTGRGEYFEIWLFATFQKTGCDPLTLQFYWDEGSDTLWEDEDGDGVGVTWYRTTGP